MEKALTIEVLNELITINNDRIECYETASKETNELDLKSLFAQFISTSQQCKQELVVEVNKLGGEVVQSTKISGKFFRVWMDVKAALTGNDRKAILNSCGYGEDAALDTYNLIIKDDLEHLSAAQQTMIIDQKSLLKGDKYYVKKLLNALIHA